MTERQVGLLLGEPPGGRTQEVRGLGAPVFERWVYGKVVVVFRDGVVDEVRTNY